MTKNDIAEKLSRQSGIKKRAVLYIINNFLDTILQAIQDGERLEFRGFGSFYRAERKQRKIYSPIAKKEVDVPGKYILAFKGSKITEIEVEKKGV